MTDLGPAHEFLAMITAEIAKEQDEVRGRIDRLRELDGSREAIEDEWYRSGLRLRPLFDQRDHIVKQLVAIEACKQLPPIVVPKDATSLAS